MKIDRALFKDFSLLLFFLFLVFLVAFLGGRWTDSSLSSWYVNLNKPSWNPPNWVFPVVWTILYGMIALSGFLVARKPASVLKKRALFFYFLQLFFNFLWSFFFFFLRNPLFGLVDLILMLLFTVLTIHYFAQIERRAALLLLPYFIWILYAATLNVAILFLN